MNTHRFFIFTLFLIFIGGQFKSHTMQADPLHTGLTIAGVVLTVGGVGRLCVSGLSKLCGEKEERSDLLSLFMVAGGMGLALGAPEIATVFTGGREGFWGNVGQAFKAKNSIDAVHAAERAMLQALGRGPDIVIEGEHISTNSLTLRILHACERLGLPMARRY